MGVARILLGTLWQMILLGTLWQMILGETYFCRLIAIVVFSSPGTGPKFMNSGTEPIGYQENNSYQNDTNDAFVLLLSLWFLLSWMYRKSIGSVVHARMRAQLNGYVPHFVMVLTKVLCHCTFVMIHPWKRNPDFGDPLLHQLVSSVVCAVHPTQISHAGIIPNNFGGKIWYPTWDIRGVLRSRLNFAHRFFKGFANDLYDS